MALSSKAAWLGLVPLLHSSGDTRVTPGSSKPVSQHLRSLLMHGDKSIRLIRGKHVSGVIRSLPERPNGEPARASLKLVDLKGPGSTQAPRATGDQCNPFFKGGGLRRHLSTKMTS